MLYVILSGALGFVVFDCYRIRATYLDKNIVLVTFSSILGVSVHVSAYIAAGILALFVNLDMIGRCCGWDWMPAANEELVGPLLRGFGVGLAGPAGLSKGKVTAEVKRSRPEDRSVDDLTLNSSLARRLKLYVNAILMR